MKNKTIIATIIAYSFSLQSYASVMDGAWIKPALPRVNPQGQLEKEIKKNNFHPVSNVNKTQKNSPTKIGGNFTYADLDMKKIAFEISEDMEFEKEALLNELRVLWGCAAEKSETIKFAVYKLSNPEGEKVDQSMVKKILSPIASVGSMVGSTANNPIAASGALIGGGILGTALTDDKLLNKQLTQVTDADLVILAKEIDNLQEKLVRYYFDYITAVKILDFTDKLVVNRHDYYQAAQKLSPAKLAVADAFYREALDLQYQARQDLLNKRTTLEQLVGNDALISVEQNIKQRVLQN